MKNENKQIRIGVEGILLKEGKVLMYKRNKKFGKGLWELPGGHLEFREDFKDCIIREFKEETGLDVKAEKLVSIDFNEMYGNHYLTFAFLVSHVNSEQKVQLLEPHAHQEWKWFDMDSLPADLFISVENTIKNFKNGKAHPYL